MMAQVCRKYLGKKPIKSLPKKETDLPKLETTPVTDTTELELNHSLLISYISGEPTSDPEDVRINGMNISTKLAIQDKKPEIPVEELVPPELHDYLDVFDETKADRFPESRPWDHKIETKEGFVPKSFKTYNLTPAEQIELDKFLKENLEKGYIRPSQSPMASPFFFVAKKDGKLRPCQDYRYLNEWMIKNAYPLPLISKLFNLLKNAEWFSKLDIRWGYNNV